jgi:hypothetical protein
MKQKRLKYLGIKKNATQVGSRARARICAGCIQDFCHSPKDPKNALCDFLRYLSRADDFLVTKKCIEVAVWVKRKF